MTIYYCDWDNGNDTTGTGTNLLPFKTITKATTGLTGGDECRVAKSATDTALTGTLGFTNRSIAVAGTDTLFTTELVVGDFVKGGDGEYYEVVTIASDTSASLFKVYPSATEAGVVGYKLGLTDTGVASATSTQIQVVSASGSSTASRLKISGGWDLSTSTQTGQTYFRQTHSTFNNRYGQGLYSSSKNYIELEKCHFLRYDNCIYMRGSDYWLVTGVNLLSAGGEAFYLYYCDNNELVDMVVNCSANRGIYLYGSNANTITTPTCNSNNYGIYLYTSSANTITTPTCNQCNPYGIYLYTSSANTITTPTCNSNLWGIHLNTSSANTITTPTCNSNTYGFLLEASSNNTITTPTCNSNYYGIYLSSSGANIAQSYSGTGNSTDIYRLPNKLYSDQPALSVQHFNTAGDNRSYYEYGVTYRDTTDARSTQCLKYDSSSATYYISQSFHFVADSGVGQTLSAYIKDDASFNGDIQAAIFFLGVNLTGWTEWTPTTSYVQKSLVAASGDVTEDGVLELRVKVRGTSGNVFVDDLATE